MAINDAHFLPNDDPYGWKITSLVNQNDTTNLGSYTTLTLRGTKPGQLDFTYKISLSKTNNDVLVSLGRANNTGRVVNIGDMDYFVSDDAEIGGTTDKWVTLGTQSRNRDYYDLWDGCKSYYPKNVCGKPCCKKYRNRQQFINGSCNYNERCFKI